MNPANWADGMNAPGGDTLAVLAVAILGGLLASAFALGGLWALRGRAALRVPECRRCRSLLRGEGLEVPARCSECGADLAPRGAVRWLRFRRQPTTFLITAPVVLIGGSVLALCLAAFLVFGLGGLISDFDRMAAARRELAQPTRPTPSNPQIVLPAESDEWSDPSLARDIATARAGGSDGSAAFASLAARAAGLVMPEGSDLVRKVKRQEADSLHALLRDYLSGTIPEKPFPADRQWGRHYALALQAVQALQWMTRGGFITREELLADTARFRGSIRVLAPQEVEPGTVIPFHLWCDEPAFLQDLRIEGIRLGTSTVYRQRFEGELARCKTPQREGSIRYDVGWALGDSEGGTPDPKTDPGRLRGVVAVDIEVSSRPGRYASAEESDLAVAPTLDRVETQVVLRPLGGRDGLWWSVRSSADGFIELAGSWTLEAGERFELGAQDGNGSAAGSALLRAPAGGWPERLALHFTPRADLLGELPSGALPGAPFLRWTEPFTLHFERWSGDDGFRQYGLVLPGSSPPGK